MKKLTIFVMAAIMTLTFASFSSAKKLNVEFKAVGDEGVVTFSHENHTETLGVKCAECHPALFKMKKGGTEGVNMASMNEGKNCGHCHNGKTEFAGKVAFDLKDAANCGKCHVKAAAK